MIICCSKYKNFNLYGFSITCLKSVIGVCITAFQTSKYHYFLSDQIIFGLYTFGINVALEKQVVVRRSSMYTFEILFCQCFLENIKVFNYCVKMRLDIIAVRSIHKHVENETENIFVTVELSQILIEHLSAHFTEHRINILSNYCGQRELHWILESTVWNRTKWLQWLRTVLIHGVPI